MKKTFGWFDSPYAFDYWIHRWKRYRNFIAVPPVYYFIITPSETPAIPPVENFFWVDMSWNRDKKCYFLKADAFVSAKRIPVLIAKSFDWRYEVLAGLSLLAQMVLPKLPEADFAGVWGEQENGQGMALSYAVKGSDVIATKANVSYDSSSVLQNTPLQVKRGRVMQTDKFTAFVFEDESYIFHKPRLERTALLSIDDLELLD